MPQSSSARADLRERHQLVSPVALAGLALLAVLALLLLFPGSGLIEQVGRYARHDEVAARYIESLLAHDPGNRGLRLDFSRRLLEQGDLRGARAAFEPLREGTGEGAHELRLFAYRLLRAESDAQRDPAAAGRMRQQLRDELAALAPLEWPAPDLVWLAGEAQALGATHLAAQLYERLALREPGRSAEWTDRAAGAALAGGHHAQAAASYLAAARRASAPRTRRAYLLKALRTLEAGNRLPEALALADAHLDELAADDAALVYLVRLARAANDQARARTYARRLLNMSGAGVVRRGIAVLLDLLASPAHAAAVSDATVALRNPPPRGMRPYDEEKYTLAYEVFVGAGSLEDAYRVAAAAVAQVPLNLVWRRRLAQVAEWTGRPAAALTQWRHLAERSAPGAEREEAWQAVLRLAPGVRDDEALLAAWLHEAATRPMTGERWRRLADAFEQVGRAADGAEFFARRYRETGLATLLELQAYLLERLGRDEAAIAAYRRLIEVHGASAPRLLRVAILLLRHNRFREAFHLLDERRAAVAGGDDEFWKLFAELAWKLQQDTAARQAYEVLAARPAAGEAEWRRLVALMRPTDPAGAAGMAALGYRRTDAPALLLTAAELHWERRDLGALRELYSALTPADEQRMKANAYFFALRAQFHDAENRTAAARADYRRAMAIEPDNPEWTVALLWHLVSRRELAELRRELAAHASRAPVARPLWEPYAAGYVVLGDLPRALHYYRLQREERRDDYLWLLNYADVLEQAGDNALALRVRRHAWQVMRVALERKGPREVSREELDALARLTLAGAPADPALRFVGRILRQDFAPPGTAAAERALDAGTREMILSWALATQRYEAARAWLWQRYARTLARPAWAEMAVALAARDRATVASLLARGADELSPADRIEAARLTGRIALARTYAFEAQTRRPDDDALHLALTQTLIETAHSVAYGGQSFERGVLQGREHRLTAAVQLTGRLRMTLELGIDDRLASTDPTALTAVPGRIEDHGVGLRWRHERGYTELRAGYRSALSAHHPLSFSHVHELTARWSGNVRASRHEKATETTPLYLGGTRDRLSAGLSYRPSLRETVSAEAWRARYHTQEGAYLGRGEGIAWELAHRFRIEYPDWRLRLAGSHQSYTADGNVDAAAARLDPSGGASGARYFVPESFDLVGLHASFGEAAREGYSRAWRYYADVGPTWNSQLGTGFLLAAGVGGSVFGGDRLSFHFTRSKGGSAIGGFTTEWGLRYEYWLAP